MAFFSPTADAYISPAAANTGGDAILLFGSVRVFNSDRALRTLLRFDLSAASGPVWMARLTLTSLGGNMPAGESTFHLAKLTQPSWTELGVMWTTYDGANVWGTAGGDFLGTPAASATIQNTATDLVFEFPVLANETIGGNLDVLIYGAENEGFSRYVQVHSRESATVAARPKLQLASVRGCLTVDESPITNISTSDQVVTNLTVNDVGCAA